MLDRVGKKLRQLTLTSAIVEVVTFIALAAFFVIAILNILGEVIEGMEPMNFIVASVTEVCCIVVVIAGAMYLHNETENMKEMQKELEKEYGKHDTEKH